jgi:hypothetical protein
MARDTKQKPTKKLEAKESQAPMAFRVSPDLRKKLEAASRSTGRSLSREIEMRLEQTFGLEGAVRETLRLAYGPTVGKAMFQFADTLRTMQVINGLLEQGRVNDDTAKMVLDGSREKLRGYAEIEVGKLEDVQ